MIDGAPMEEKQPKITVTAENNKTVTKYLFDGGLTLTNTFTTYPEHNACDWVNEWENCGDTESGIISALWDADFTLPLPPCTPKTTGRAYLPASENVVKVLCPRGSEWSGNDFYRDVDELTSNNYPCWLQNVGAVKRYASAGGRSANTDYAPFFNIKHGGEPLGYIVAVGWTGQWNAEAERLDTGVRFKSKIEDTCFKILPGERFRTSSVTVLSYHGEIYDGQNLWRRFIRDVYSPIKNPEKELPFCAGLWGGMSTDECLKRIRAVEKAGLPFNCYWMDAGWYGFGTQPSPDEYEGDWAAHTGNWVVNSVRHPDGLMDVVKEIDKTDKRFLLWFEPERIRKGMPITEEHPEYLIFPTDEKNQNILLNLGNEAAWQYCFETLSDFIEKMHISIYRQDFNFTPLSYWRQCNEKDRVGITEIKHINGLYRLWDALLDKFPHLIIDNCASGGRRIDIETLRRSVPLWRSDAQCPAEIDPSITQAHALSYGAWMPYSGTGTGRTLFDTYRIRSAYAPALTTNYTFSEKNEFGDDPKAIEWIDTMAKEYLRVKPYLYKDIYPLTVTGTKSDDWSAVQYHDTETDSGIVLVFRRESSPYRTADFTLRGLTEGKEYIFEDADGGEPFDINSANFTVTIEEKRRGKLYFYQEHGKKIEDISRKILKKYSRAFEELAK